MYITNLSQRNIHTFYVDGHDNFPLFLIDRSKIVKHKTKNAKLKKQCCEKLFTLIELHIVWVILRYENIYLFL